MAISAPAIDLPNKAYILPKAIPMWPPAWWTWAALALILLLILFVIIMGWLKYKRNSYRREALSTLKRQTPDLSDKETIILCHELIRRSLISEHKRAIAALPTEALFQLLDEDLPHKKRFHLLGNLFIQGPYQANPHISEQDKKRMIETTHYWLRKHHA